MLGRCIPCILYRRCIYLVVSLMLTGYVGYSLVVALQAKGSYSRGMLDMSAKLRLMLHLTAKGVRNMLYFAYTAKYTNLNIPYLVYTATEYTLVITQPFN